MTLVESFDALPNVKLAYFLIVFTIDTQKRDLC